MNTQWIKTASALLAACAISTAAFATTITGAITFDGSVNLNGSAGTATQVDSWVNPTVGDADGDFATYVTAGQTVAIVAPWSFNTNVAIPNFWQVGGFSFQLLSSSVIFQTPLGTGSVLVNGVGKVTGNGFDATTGTWSFTTQGPAANGSFTFSAATGAVPEGGMTAVMLGVSLAAMGLLGLRRKTA